MSEEQKDEGKLGFKDFIEKLKIEMQTDLYKSERDSFKKQADELRLEAKQLRAWLKVKESEIAILKAYGDGLLDSPVHPMAALRWRQATRPDLYGNLEMNDPDAKWTWGDEPPSAYYYLKDAADNAISKSAFHISISEIGGSCPSQAVGYIRGSKFGSPMHPYYFRARHGIWSLSIGKAGENTDEAGSLDWEQIAVGDDSTNGNMDASSMVAAYDPHLRKWYGSKYPEQFIEGEDKK